MFYSYWYSLLYYYFFIFPFSILNDDQIILLLVLLLCPPHSYIVSKLTPLQVDFVTYMDDLAGEIGVRPSLPWLFFTDYQLFKRVLWGPVSSYQYRLMGPGKWDGARRAIFTQFDRMTQVLKTRKVNNRLLIPHSINHYMLQMCFLHLIHNVCSICLD